MISAETEAPRMNPGRNEFGVASNVVNETRLLCAGAACQSASYEPVSYGVTRPIGLIDRVERKPIHPDALAEILTVFAPSEVLWLMRDQTLGTESELIRKETDEAFRLRATTSNPAGHGNPHAAPVVFTSWAAAHPHALPGVDRLLSAFGEETAAPSERFRSSAEIAARNRQIGEWEAKRDKAAAALRQARDLYVAAEARGNTGQPLSPSLNQPTSRPDESAVQSIEATYIDFERDITPMVQMVYRHFATERDFVRAGNLLSCEMAQLGKRLDLASDFRRLPFDERWLGVSDDRGKTTNFGYSLERWYQIMTQLWGAIETMTPQQIEQRHVQARAAFTRNSSATPDPLLFLPAVQRAIGSQRHAPDASKTFEQVTLPRFFRIPERTSSTKRRSKTSSQASTARARRFVSSASALAVSTVLV